MTKEFTMSEKQGQIADALGTRPGRRSLAHAMIMPILGKGQTSMRWHPCDQCGLHEACSEDFDAFYDERKGRSGDCWVPKGFLAVYDEVPV